MKPPSELFDLLERDGTRHVNAKAMSFYTTTATFLLILIALLADYVFTWPFVAALLLLMYGHLGLDGLKTIAKLRWGPEQPKGDAPAQVRARRALGAAEGVEPAP